jgi:hypothetical protein
MNQYDNDDYLESLYGNKNEIPNDFRWGLALFSLGLIGFILALVFVLLVLDGAL